MDMDMDMDMDTDTDMDLKIIERKKKCKSKEILLICEFFTNILLAVGLFYAIFSILELKKQVEDLKSESATIRNILHQLDEDCSFLDIFPSDESSSLRDRREINFNGEETFKQLTNEDRLAKGLEELQKRINDSHGSPQTMKAIMVPSFERQKESEIQTEKPVHRNATTTESTAATTEQTDHRKTHKERSPRKKFHSALLAQDLQVKESRQKDTNRLVAIHYSGSLANHSLRHHPLHKGNGIVTLPSSLYQYWIPVPWTEDLRMSDHFQLNGSDIKAHKNGLYLIYSQIQYLTTGKKDDNGYKIFRNSEPIAQCIFTKTVIHDKPSPQTCSLTTVAALSSNDKIYIRDISHKPTVALSPEKSFLGLILITPT